jgi:hypothetical protein
MSVDRKIQFVKPPIPGRPPGFPWQELRPNANAESYLCFYYVSPFSAYPVRDVNRIVSSGNGGFVADCKVDPNWETGTFGLFSTCQASIRCGVVNRRSPYLFFFGDHASDGERGVTGYYRLRWYAHGGMYDGDYCLAAEKTHFVKRAISFADVNQRLGTSLSGRVPRLSIKLSPTQSKNLIEMLEAQPDATDSYVSEVSRLEEINARNANGLRYVNFARRDSYSWTSIENISGVGMPSDQKRQKNSGSTNAWRCDSCKMISLSRSLLKLCPNCQGLGTLRPI